MKNSGKGFPWFVLFAVVFALGVPGAGFSDHIPLYVGNGGETLSGSNLNTTYDTITVGDGGTLTIDGTNGNVVVAHYLRVGDNGTGTVILNSSPGNANALRLFERVGVDNNSGDWISQRIGVGNNRGVFIQNGGLVTGAASGAASYTNPTNYNGLAHINNLGISIGSTNPEGSHYYLNDGVLNVAYNNLRVGDAGKGTFVQNGGIVRADGATYGGVYIGNEGTYDLNAGLLTAEIFQATNDSAVFNLNGGMLVFKAGNNNLVSGSGNAEFNMAGGTLLLNGSNGNYNLSGFNLRILPNTGAANSRITGAGTLNLGNAYAFNVAGGGHLELNTNINNGNYTLNGGGVLQLIGHRSLDSMTVIGGSTLMFGDFTGTAFSLEGNVGTPSNTVSINSATETVSGSFTGSVNNIDGIFDLTRGIFGNNPPADVTLNGTYSQDAGGTLRMELYREGDDISWNHLLNTTVTSFDGTIDLVLTGSGWSTDDLGLLSGRIQLFESDFGAGDIEVTINPGSLASLDGVMWKFVVGEDGFGYLNLMNTTPSDDGVPEPATWGMLILGVSGMLFLRKRTW